jgi:hypothetical protein
VLREAVERRAPSLRCDPTFYGLEPDGGAMRALATACGVAGMPLLMAVRLEDGRQRHPNDVAAELPPSAGAALLRVHPGVRLIITHADRDFIEQVHFGSTPAEAPGCSGTSAGSGDHRKTICKLCWAPSGSGDLPFNRNAIRLPENSLAKLDLLELTESDREAIEQRNLERFLGAGVR